MGFFIFLILALLFIVYGLPRILQWWLPRYVRKKASSFENQQRRYREEYMRQNRQAGWSSEPRTKKKITRDMGEYIEFEELTTETETHSPDGDTTKKEFTAESQITDVKWEEID